MDPSARVARTDRGSQELRERAHGFSQGIRMVLFLADGTRTAAAIAQQLPAVRDVPLILNALVREGLIALVQPAPAPAPLGEEDIRQAMAGLSRYLYDALGADAATLSIKLETARDRGEFAQAVRRAIVILQSVTGQQYASQFQARAQAILDTFFAPRT